MSVLKDLSNPFDYRHLSWLDTLVFLLDEFYTRLDWFVWALHKMLQRVKIKKYPSLCTVNFHSKFGFLERWPPPQKKTAILTPITNLTCRWTKGTISKTIKNWPETEARDVKIWFAVTFRGNKHGEGLAEDNLSFSLPFEKHDDCWWMRFTWTW